MNKFVQYLDRHSPTLIYVFIALMFVGSIFGAAQCNTAHAHDQLPTPTTFTSGQTLTAQALNDTINHTHNTLNGGITNTHISNLAAIASSKLAAGDLIPLGLFRLFGTCSGAGTVGAACALNVAKGAFVGTGLGLMKSGTVGRWAVHAASPRLAGIPVVTVQSQTASVVCQSVDYASSVNPHFYIECRTIDTGVLTDALFTVVMW